MEHRIQAERALQAEELGNSGLAEPPRPFIKGGFRSIVLTTEWKRGRGQLGGEEDKSESKAGAVRRLPVLLKEDR